MLSQQANYKTPLLISLTIHAVLIIMLLADLTFEHAPAVTAQGQDKVEMIQAVAINQQKLSIAINKVKAAQQAKQQELAKQQQLQRQREQEQQRVAQLQQKAAELARQQELQRQQQEALQQRAQQIKQQNEALAQQQQQEQQRLATIQQQRQQAEEKQRIATQQEALANQQKALEAAKQQALDAAKQKAVAAAKLKAAAAAKERALAAAKRHDAQVAHQKALADAKRKATAAEAAAEAKLQDELASKEAQFARTQGIVNKYQALIRQAIGQQWIVPPSADKHLSCKFQIHIAPGGTVLNVTLLRSSGDPILDRSAQNAIYKASPLPVPDDKDAFEIFRSFSLIVRPEGAVAEG